MSYLAQQDELFRESLLLNRDLLFDAASALVDSAHNSRYHLHSAESFLDLLKELEKVVNSIKGVL